MQFLTRMVSNMSESVNDEMWNIVGVQSVTVDESKDENGAQKVEANEVGEKYEISNSAHVSVKKEFLKENDNTESDIYEEKSDESKHKNATKTIEDNGTEEVEEN